MACLMVFTVVFTSFGQDFAAKTTAETVNPPKLTAAEVIDWRVDLNFIATEFPAKHANLFHRLDRKKFDSAVEQLDAEIPNLTRKQIALEMARIVGLPRDGHSYLRTIWEPNLKFQYLPIRLYVFSDGVYVIQAADEYKNILGARLLKVEGLPVEKAIEKIGPYMSSDNELGSMEYAPFFLVSPDILKALRISKDSRSASYEFVKDGKPISIKAKLDDKTDNSFAGVSKRAETWADVRSNASNPLPLTFKFPKKGHWFEFDASKKMLFVQMNNVLNGEKKTIEQFFGEVVEFVGKNDVDKLVLDLRHNGGGNNTLVRPIIRGLIQMKHIDKKGHLFVVTGRKTFSAAQNLVNQLESWTNASFIGEPTGSHVNMYGDARSFYLPKSGLRLRISELFWQNKHARDERRWTAPHFAAEPTFVDYKNNIDPAMRAIEIFESKPTLLEMALKRQAKMDLAGFRKDVIAFKNDPANKYAEIEGQINRFGYNMINAKQYDAAVGLLSINVELYPESFNAYDSLAEAYMLKGDTEKAVRFYKKSLELNAGNTNATRMLEQIKHRSKTQEKAQH
jgi:hypothetical protein